MSDFVITSDAGKDMIEELPAVYGSVLEVQVILQAEGTQFDQLQSDLDDQLAQRFVGSATWSIEDWEEEFGIVPAAGQPLEQRRAIIKAKMRGYGKFTGRLMKNVAMAYENGEIDVSFNPASSTFTIRFISTLGAPPNINDLQKAIAEIVPSHLLVSYSYRYLTINEVNSMTINEIENHPLSDFAPFLD
ncbi:putative phage tail protein [Paenibacillus gansuensis]|uniref:Phage tail protein n=1 Tax=Paenibacillus gansuensis TaxID=306542 RepID=A0ABW5PE41_9BACL